MAASVRIEDEAFSDRRYDRLAAECGLADADHARGKMAVLWRQCTLEHRHVLPPEDVHAVLGPNGVAALVAARLGDETPKGIRIRGTRGRIEWLKRLRENGSKGGRPRKPDGYPSGSADANPPAPAPAPAPALVPVQETSTRGRPRERVKFEPPTVAEVAAYCRERGNTIDPEAFVAHYTANGWVQSNGRPIKNWRAAVVTWEKNQSRFGSRPGPSGVSHAKRHVPGRFDPERHGRPESASCAGPGGAGPDG